MRASHPLPQVLPLLALLCSVQLLCGQNTQNVLPPVTGEEEKFITEALPKQATVKPKKERRVLVFHRTEGFVHKCIPVGNEALRRLGESTGAYQAEFSQEMEAFEPKNLERFDLVLFHNTTQLKFENPVYREALLKFVRSGKGVAGVHAASDNFPSWPEGQELIGGVFHGHPWGSNDLVAIKVDEPEHPLNKGFGKTGFWLREEIYQLKEPYSREKLRVILSLDMSKPENARPADKIKRTDSDFGISWLKTHQGGRVFYTSLGHRPDIFFVPEILQHLLDGIQYALGDLPADAVPSLKLKTVPTAALAPEDRTTLQEKVTGLKAASFNPPTQPEETEEQLWQTFAAFQPGQPSAVFLRVEQKLRTMNLEQRRQQETRILTLVQDTKLHLMTRQAAIRLLRWVGTDTAVPVLEKLALDPQLGEGAVGALSLLGSEAAGQALLRLSGRSSKELQTAVVAGLSRYPSKESIESLRKMTRLSGHTGWVAARSLALIGTEPALDALWSVLSRETGSPEKSQLLLTALANTWPQLSPEQKKAWSDKAGKYVRSQLTPKTPDHLRAQAALLLIKLEGAAAAKELIALVEQASPLTGRNLLRELTQREEAEVLAEIQSRWIKWHPWQQQVVLGAALEQAAARYLPLAETAIGLETAEVRGLAYKLLARIGTSEADRLLIGALSRQPQDIESIRNAARSSTSPTMEGQLREMLVKATDEKERIFVIGVLSDRQDRGCFEQILPLCKAPEDGLRAAAFQAVATLVRPGDLERVIGLVDDVKKGADRKEWRRALFAAASMHTVMRGTPPNSTGRPPVATPAENAADATRILQKALQRPENPERGAFIGALAMVPGDASAAALQQMLQAKTPDARKEVIRALSAARTREALTALQKAVLTLKEADEKTLALRGSLETIGALSEMNNNDKVKTYRELWNTNPAAEEKEAILAALKGMKSKLADELLKEIAPAPVAAENKQP